jgi:predicted AlkP superfamily phosphohydrolase/phosphomutase
MSRFLPTALAALVLLTASCRAPSDGDAPLPEFPLEKSAADFPGLSYPPHEGKLPQPASLNGPVWLIGIDGATWDLIDPLLERGELPNFAALVEDGAHGVLLSEEPMISPALWATIATGMPRFEHGIVNFLVKIPGSRRSVQAGPPDRRSPAIWELVGAAGGRSAVISWFGSFPAEEIPGYYISKGFDPGNLRPEQVHPDSLIEVLGKSARPRIQKAHAEAIALSNFLSDTLLEDARSLAAWRTIISGDDVDFLALYFSGVDVVQHVTWKHMDPSSQQFPQDGDPDPRFSDVIHAYYRLMDDVLGEMRRAAPPGTTLAVVSDHGGGPMQPAEAYHFQLEVLLQQLGLMGKDGSLFAIGELYRHDKSIWLDAERGDVETIRARLERLQTDDGSPLFAAVIDHTKDDGWNSDLPALTVRFSAAALLTSTVVDGGRNFDFAPVRLRHTDVSGAHRLEGVIVLQGPAIAPGRLTRAVSLYNVAPTLLYLLGLPQDENMLRFAPADGGVLREAIDPHTLELHPIDMISEYPGTDRSELLRSKVSDSFDPTAEEAMEKLRSLGYIR